MPTSSLLARITLALSAVSAVSIGVVACGGETADGSGTGGTNAAGTGGTNAAGTGGTNAAGTGGTNAAGTGGTNAAGQGGSATTCDRPLPEAGACRSNGDCDTAGFAATCFGPGTSSCDGLGGPQQPSCQVDTDCAQQGFPADYSCQPQAFSDISFCRPACTTQDSCGSYLECDAATARCKVPSCAASACPQDTYYSASKECRFQACNANRPCKDGFSCSTTDFTCSPTPCTGAVAGECPSSFVCDPASQVCLRQTCACDTDCAADGFCVQGLCYPTAGHCDGGCAVGRPLVLADGGVLVARLLRGAASVVGWSGAASLG
jgi:hypothetical protein